MIIVAETVSLDEVELKEVGYSVCSTAHRRKTLRKLWEKYPMAARICLVERGETTDSLWPGAMEVYYVMPKRGLYNRKVEIRVGTVLEAVS